MCQVIVETSTECDCPKCGHPLVEGEPAVEQDGRLFCCSSHALAAREEQFTPACR